jgi:putative ABC transport system permease protein
MFYLRYIASELRRRRGRTILTALGLGVGVGLVVTVTALSTGLDDAQSEVLEPLTGVGTDMTVNRPVTFDEGEAGIAGPGGLSAEEQEQLQEENGELGLDFGELGDPGEQFETDRFVTTELSFDQGEVNAVSRLDGVDGVSSSLTLDLIHLEGTVPSSEGPMVFGGPAGAAPEEAARGEIGFEPTSVTGIDASERDLGPVNEERVTHGRFLAANDADGAMLSRAYADENGLAVGDEVSVGDRKLEIVGIVSAPIGGNASDIYMDLGTLQKVSDREGRVNSLEVRAASVDDVDAVADRIEDSFAGSEVTTASDLADRVSGSLVDAQNLSDKLGTALAVVSLAAAFLIASLLTLASVNKRTRELGTLKALGWRQWRVVRQVTGESVAQGLIGGAVGALIGIGGAALIGALGISLEASAGATEGTGGFGPIRPAADQVVAGSSTVTLDAPVDAGLLLLAIALAVIGGLIAGAVGGTRAARLRPAEALRSVE